MFSRYLVSINPNGINNNINKEVTPWIDVIVNIGLVLVGASLLIAFINFAIHKKNDDNDIKGLFIAVIILAVIFVALAGWKSYLIFS